MKKNKITALFMSFVMCAAVTSTYKIQASAETADSDVLTKVDFEEFTEGYVFEDPGWVQKYRSSNGQLYFEGSEKIDKKNKASIETDPQTGSKALKLERNTEKVNVWYILDNKLTSGTYKVSMDIRLATASGSYEKFAAVCGDTEKHISIISPALYNKTLVNGSISTNQWWGVDMSDQKMRYEYTIDLDNNKVYYQILRGTDTIKRGFADSLKSGTSIDEIFMGINDPSNNSGLYRGWDYQSEDNPIAVTYIDNIEVKKCSNRIASLDFDGNDEGLITDCSNINSNSGFYAEKGTGDRVEIKTDPKTNSKALKLTVNNKIYLRYALPKAITEKSVVSFDTRIAKASRYTESIGALATGDWYRVIIPRIKGSTLCDADNPLEFNYKQVIGNEYARYEWVADPETKTVMLSIYDNTGKCVYTKTKTYTFTSNLSAIEFCMSSVYPELGWDYDAEDVWPGEIYIDNIQYSTYKFNPIAFSIKDGAVDVAKNEKLYVSFNGIPDESDLTSENFKLYRNNTLMDASMYKISAFGENCVSVAPKNGFVYGDEYKLSVNAGITSGNDISDTAMETSFTVEKYDDEIVIENIDFENYDEDKAFTQNDVKNWLTNGSLSFSGLNTNNTVKVVTDPVTKSKALKFEKDQSSKLLEMFYVLKSKGTSGVYEISYDLRTESVPSGFKSMGNLTPKDSWDSIINLQSWSDGGLCLKKWNDWIGINYNSDAGHEVFNVKYRVNLDSKKVTYTLKAAKKTVTNTVDFYSAAADDFGRFCFGMVNAAELKGWEYDAENSEKSAVVYLDNIRVIKKAAPEIVWTTPNNGAENVKLNSDITVSTSVALDPESVTRDNIILADADSNVPDYSVSVSEDKNIRITLNETLKEKTNYTVTIKGIKTVGSDGLTMVGSQSFSFTTSGKYNLDIVSVIENTEDPTKQDITFELDNHGVNEGIELIFASFDGKRLTDVVLCDKKIPFGEKIYASVTLKKASIHKAFIWTADNKMTPVDNALLIAAASARTYGIDNLNDSSKDITIGFIGGSITQQEQWITPLKSYFDEKYSGKKVNYIIAGVGGTGSALQQYRVYNDIISQNPDLVFVDSTINDANNASSKIAYENVIRKLLTANHQPAVISVAFGSKTLTTENKNWKATFDEYSEINDYYGIPYINVQKYAEDKIADGTVEGWDEITSDGTHPNQKGGELYAECIINLLQKDFQSYVKRAVWQLKAMNENISEYENAREIAWQDGSYKGSWAIGKNTGFKGGSAETSTEGDSVTVTYYGKSIAIYTNCGTNGMNIDYNLDDGAKTGTVSSFVNSWDFNQSGATAQIKADSVGTHTVTFTARGTGKENAKLVIGYFLVY